MSTTRRYIRHSREQWAELIALQPGSGLSASKFCEQAGISYQSFMGWRKKLRAPGVASNDSARFVELTTTGQPAEPHDSVSAGSAGEWQVELDLGNGIQLRIAQC